MSTYIWDLVALALPDEEPPCCSPGDSRLQVQESSRAGKKRVISMLILIMTTHYPYQHGNNSKSRGAFFATLSKSTTRPPMTTSSVITTNAQYDWLVKMSLIPQWLQRWLALTPTTSNSNKCCQHRKEDRSLFCFGDGHKNALMNPNIHLSPFDPKKQRLAILRVGRETVIRRDLQYSRNYETLQNRNSV